MKKMKRSISYKNSGVDIENGNLFVRQIKPMAKATSKRGVLADIGSFGALFRIDSRRHKDPVLVSSTDGVGTKLMLAQEFGIHNTIGFDLVGMCVNDVATTGAQPLFFLDYIACGKIDAKVLKDVVSGIARACKRAGYALIGGETAEMPGMYKPGKYDLAGFCVGIAEKKEIIDGSSIRRGDVVIGLESNGLHSNGYSLVRKIFSKKELIRLGNELLMPTRLYTKPLLVLQKKVKVKGIAHITGGAYVDKIPRIIPKGLGVEIKKGSWPIRNIFKLIQEKGNVRESEMYRVFNMGIGMALVVSSKDAKKACGILSKSREKAWVIGEVVRGKGKVNLI